MTKPRITIDHAEPAAAAAPVKPVDASLPIKEQVIGHLQNVQDPEMSINVYDLGLIYAIKLNAAESHADITMTLTSAWCPVADNLVTQVKQSALNVAQIKTAEVTVTFDPPWTRDRMSEAAKLESGML